MKNSKWLASRALPRLRAVLNFALLILNVELAVLCTACGGNAPDNSTPAPSLEGGERVEEPRHKIPPAPTPTHERLARLFPGTSALVEDSITYCGWNADQAQSYTDAMEREGAVKAAPLPCVRARYSSTGFEKVEGGEKGVTTAKHTFPQVCDLFIIQAPAPDAALAIARKIEAKLAKEQFSQKDPLTVTSGQKDVAGLTIGQWLRVDAEEKQDTAFVGYTAVVGSLVLFAREVEVRKPLVGPGKEEIRLPANTQMGSRLGAQLIILVNDALTR